MTIIEFAEANPEFYVEPAKAPWMVRFGMRDGTVDECAIVPRDEHADHAKLAAQIKWRVERAKA